MIDYVTLQVRWFDIDGPICIEVHTDRRVLMPFLFLLWNIQNPTNLIGD